MVGVLDVEGFFAWEQAVSGTQAKNGTILWAGTAIHLLVLP